MIDPPDGPVGFRGIRRALRAIAGAVPLPRFQPDPALAECAAQGAVMANSTPGGNRLLLWPDPDPDSEAAPTD